MKRRDLVQNLLAAEPQPLDQAAIDAKARVPSGAVRAIGLELSRLGNAAHEASRLREQLHTGNVVLDLDPSLVSSSFVSDRLSRNEDPDYRKLVESIRESGQQVPILVRPHPEQRDGFQVAFGHRRRDAARELGIAVRAIVRPLSDQELIVAQGKENAERRNLSFIERAMFAAAMENRGFQRAVINASLGVLTSETTRLLAVAAAIPADIAAAIGSAPKAGRPRWLELSRLLSRDNSADAAHEVIAGGLFRSASSDRRFEMLLLALKDGKPQTKSLEFKGRDGAVVARAEQSSRMLRVTIDERTSPGLSQQVLDLLSSIIDRHERP